MFKFIRQLFCIHDYYTINIMYDIYDLDNKITKISLYEFKRCKKCNKFKIIKINSFTCFNKEEVCVITKLIRNHGAVHYLEFLDSCAEKSANY